MDVGRQALPFPFPRLRVDRQGLRDDRLDLAPHGVRGELFRGDDEEVRTAEKVRQRDRPREAKSAGCLAEFDEMALRGGFVERGQRPGARPLGPGDRDFDPAAADGSADLFPQEGLDRRPAGRKTGQDVQEPMVDGLDFDGNAAERSVPARPAEAGHAEDHGPS